MILAEQLAKAQNSEPRSHITSKVRLFIACFPGAHTEKKSVLSRKSALTIGFQQTEE